MSPSRGSLCGQRSHWVENRDRHDQSEENEQEAWTVAGAAPGGSGNVDMTTPHAAAASAAGYQYQTWWSLLEMLRTGPDRPDATLVLEMYDDVAWEDGGTPTELLQTKHHQVASRSLSDMSDDVWRSLQVWLDIASPSDPAGPLMHLVSTDLAPTGTAAHVLRSESRDVHAAVTRLTAAAEMSSSGASERARARFLDLGASGRTVFLSRVFMVDGAPRLEDVDAQVRRVLAWALPRGHEDVFMHLLWGWWDAQAVGMLRGKRVGVGAPEVYQKISDIRDQFTQDRLPTLVELRDVDTEDVFAAHNDHAFVAQLGWINWPPLNLQKAVVDFFRAYTQTAWWVSDDLIGIDELQRFEDELVDEWQREFEFMQIDLGANADDEDKQRAGSDLLRQLLNATEVRVRARYDDAFFARGKRHELADSGRIGWHADFEERLRALLLSA